MKLIHLGDLHLGKSLGEYDLAEDQRYILKQILQLIKKESVDAVLIAGDVYDKAVPSESATRLLDEFLCELAELGVKTFIISGNHDSDDRLNYGSELFQKNKIFISAVYQGELYHRTLMDEYGEVNVWLLPFVKASQVRHFFPDKNIRDYETAVRTVLETAVVDKSRRNILVAHQFVAGKGMDPDCAGSETAAVQSVGLVEKIGYDCFHDFDYVALGHIHAPQRIGRDEVRYCGSPLKYSLSEAGNEKSVPLITLGQKGEVRLKLIPLEPKRDVRHIRGTVEELLNRENVGNTEDFIYATITDEDVINDVMGIFRQYYPNIVKIDYDNSHTREINEIDLSAGIEKKSFGELIEDFYCLMYGCEISSEEMEVMKQAAEEAGIINEAD